MPDSRLTNSAQNAGDALQALPEVGDADPDGGDRG